MPNRAFFEGRPVEILLVEDNPADGRLAREALRDAKLSNILHQVVDGQEAMRFLNREGEYPEAPRPDIILLDLNLPGMSGREVLVKIKADGRLKDIPVVVLTSSASEQDIVASYTHHANCFVTKPVDFHKFTEVVKQVGDFWFTVVKLPPHE